MLDDLKYIHEKDTEDALGLVEKQWQQVSQDYDLPKLSGKFQNIVHSGMGGSALWALFTTSWPGYNVPFEVVRDYTIPSYVDKKTLFVASSYSGNTEEILEAIGLAAEKGAYIVVIASGGKLADVAREKGYPLALLPKIDKPRYAAFYGWRALILIAEQLGLLATPKAADELQKTDKFLKASIAQWLPTVPTKQNLAKQIARELMGKSAVIYSGRLLAPAAHKWKISINENSKNIAFEYTFPEFNHNEFTGWTSHPTSKPYAVVYLKSPNDHPRVKKRFVLSDKLLSGRWPSPINVEVQGKSELEQILWAVSLGDFVSIYLALLNGVNPIDTGDRDIIEKFKKELA
jgi:glucose/mannose-6-phosphate isomerase